jgi:hypothetical protein
VLFFNRGKFKDIVGLEKTNNEPTNSRLAIDNESKPGTPIKFNFPRETKRSASSEVRKVEVSVAIWTLVVSFC